MKIKVLVGLLALLIVCLSLIGCKERIPVPPVDTAQDIAKLVEEGMTLDRVYELMSTRLKNATVLYRAQKLERRISGSWKVGSVEGGIPEDSDTPYNVLIFAPDTVDADCYMIFLENESVIGADWFSPAAANTIQSLLEGTVTAK